MPLTKRPAPDGTFELLRGGKVIARGLSELDADVQIAGDRGETGPPQDSKPGTADDPAGAAAGGRKDSK